MTIFFTKPSDWQARFDEAAASHLGLAVHEITENKRWREDLGCDSLDMVELAMLVEETFDIEVPDAEIEDCATVRDAYDLLRRKLEVEG